MRTKLPTTLLIAALFSTPLISAACVQCAADVPSTTEETPAERDANVAESIVIEEIAGSAERICMEGAGVDRFLEQLLDKNNHFDPNEELTDTYETPIFVARCKGIVIYCYGRYFRCVDTKTKNFWFCRIPSFKCKNRDVNLYILHEKEADAGIRREVRRMIKALLEEK